MTYHAFSLVFVIIGSLSSGCIVPRSTTQHSSAGTASTATTEATGYEPGMLELDTALGSDNKWHLVLAGGLRTADDPPMARIAFTRDGEADRWRSLYVCRQFHDGITTLGGAQVSREGGELQAKELDNAPIISGPGSYSLKLDLGGTIVSTSVEVVEVNQTSGQIGLGISPASYLNRAAIRFDRDVHGIDIGYPHEPRLWITLRAPMTREATRADFLWYRGKELVAQSSQEQSLGGIGLGTAFERPVRFWTWPKDVKLDEMMDGQWTTYVYQEGTYQTACSFQIASGKIVGRAPSSAPLSCQKLQPPSDVTRRGGQLSDNPEAPNRRAELVALFKSEETRHALIELISARRAQNEALLSRGSAVDDENKAWTKTQADRAVQRYERANAAAKDIRKDIVKLSRRYAALVAKHGRE